MQSAKIVVNNKLGLHARASAKLTQLAAQFPCEVHIERSGRSVNAKSIMGVMMLAAGLGAEVTITANGEREDDALKAIVELFRSKFGEGE